MPTNKTTQKKPTKKKKCRLCGRIPEVTTRYGQICSYENKLSSVGGRGVYYRGPEAQRTEYRLYKCLECKKFFESSTNYYSDPDSDMGMGRDSSESHSFQRIKPKRTRELLERLLESCTDCYEVRQQLDKQPKRRTKRKNIVII